MGGGGGGSFILFDEVAKGRMSRSPPKQSHEKLGLSARNEGDSVNIPLAAKVFPTKYNRAQVGERIIRHRKTYSPRSSKFKYSLHTPNERQTWLCLAPKPKRNFKYDGAAFWGFA